MQRNWIGRSRGAEVDFAIDGSDKKLTVFTTRPDTLYGATFMVVAPEHPIVHEITTVEHKDTAGNYIKAAQAKSDVERQETEREKTGAFTGAYAINPVNDKKIPIWIADYVLYNYGTGAIMAVPGHDQRDRDFAQKFDLPIIEVVTPETGEPQENPEFRRSIVAIVHDPKDDKFLSINWGKYGGNMFVGGGREENEDIIEAAKREVTEETGYKNLKFVGMTGAINHNYFAHSKNVARRIEAHGILFELEDDEKAEVALEQDEVGKFKVEWLSRADAEAKIKEELHATAYSLLVKGECYHGEGMMMNSGPYDGIASSAARDKIVADLEAKGLAKERINYKIRDWLISRQRYWGAPIPIVHCAKDGAVAVPEDQLPVVLPEMESYEPSGDGRSPLARAEDWVNTTCPKCGGPAMRETDTMDGFACSSWYFLRFADPHNAEKAFDDTKVKHWLPVDDYIGGAEHAVMHLLYARFWTKVMKDEGLIDFNEPFRTLRNQGMILAPDGNKMSKSKGNTIEPDGLIEQGYGADCIRIMELFIGPWNQAVNWSVEGMGGSFRFLQRIWTLVQEFQDFNDDKMADDKLIYQAIHRAIKKVTSDLENLSFNTAIATLMETVNELYRVKTQFGYMSGGAWRLALENLVQLLAPFAPHIAEELWQQLGHNTSIHTSEWPKYDEQYLVSDTMTIVVQINGKVRAQLEVPADATEEQIVEKAKADEKVAGYLDGKEIRKTIYVPGKLISFVI
jgi:leucyl-tRNA synthetase